ncbi:LuxR C-terminal-related transcriptional regulator [Micromonospora sp. NPDC047074]|uniref:LuxR C-terminal-related transcriptional regulator n=1 Tax=Micromonospora sp. NPDC047074 TaxID=3154339 RepID=UPI0033D295A3
MSGWADPLRVRVAVADPRGREDLLAMLTGGGVAVVDEADGPADVLLAAADTLDEALALCDSRGRPGGATTPALAMVGVFAPAAMRRAIAAGVRTMLWRAEATPANLLAALHSARHGDGRLPYAVLVRLLGAEPRPASAPPSPLTVRQTEVLALMAEGHGNAAIARMLRCSEHTVKNVSYELMARLQVRNRAQAVARAVRAGLI